MTGRAIPVQPSGGPGTGLAGPAMLGGGVMLAAQGLRLGLNLVATVVLARLLAPAEFGLIGMVTAITGFAASFKDLGLSHATIQRRSISDVQVSTLFWVNVAFSILTMIAIVAIAPVIAWFYGEPRLSGIAIAIAGTFLLSGLTVQHQALLQRRMRFLALAALDVGALAVGFIVALVAAVNEAGYWALVLMHVTTALTLAVGTWSVSRWRPGRPVFNAESGELLRFGGDLTAFNVVNYVARNIDHVLIGRVWGAVQLGLYSRAYQLLLLPIQMAAAPIGTVAIPVLSRLTDAPDRYRRAYTRIIEKVAALAMPLVAFMAATADWMIELALGAQWNGASGIFAWLAVAAFTQPIGHSTGWLFISQGRTAEMRRWGAIGSAIVVASILLGLPWGAVGVAASYAIIGLVIRTPLLFWYVGRHGPVRTADLYRAPLPAATAAAALLLVISGLRHVVPGMDPLHGVVLAAAVAVPTTVLVLFMVPSGRSMLQDLRVGVGAVVRHRNVVAGRRGVTPLPG